MATGTLMKFPGEKFLWCLNSFPFFYLSKLLSNKFLSLFHIVVRTALSSSTPSPPLSSSPLSLSLLLSHSDSFTHSHSHLLPLTLTRIPNMTFSLSSCLPLSLSTSHSLTPTSPLFLSLSFYLPLSNSIFSYLSSSLSFYLKLSNSHFFSLLSSSLSPSTSLPLSPSTSYSLPPTFLSLSHSQSSLSRDDWDENMKILQWVKLVLNKRILKKDGTSSISQMLHLIVRLLGTMQNDHKVHGSYPTWGTNAHKNILA